MNSRKSEQNALKQSSDYFCHRRCCSSVGAAALGESCLCDGTSWDKQHCLLLWIFLSVLVLLFGAFSSLTAAAEGGMQEGTRRSYSRALNSLVLLSASIQTKNSLNSPEINPGLALLQLMLLTLCLSA